MVEVNCIKVRDYKDFKYKGFTISNIWKGIDDEENKTFMWFDVHDPQGTKIENQTFCTETTLFDLKRFIKDAINHKEYFMCDYGDA